MKVNLPAHEVFTTSSMNKKKKSSHLLWLLPLNLIRQMWIMWFNPVSTAFFIRGSTSLIEFVFFILFRQEQKILAGKSRLLACDQKRKSLIGWDFGIQECWEVIRKNLLRKRNLQRKNAYILHFYSTKFECMARVYRCSSTFKSVSQYKKVYNQWLSECKLISKLPLLKVPKCVITQLKKQIRNCYCLRT